MRLDVTLGGKTHSLELTPAPANENASGGTSGAGLWNCRINGREVAVNAIQIAPDTLSLVIDGQSVTIMHQISAGKQQIVIRGIAYDTLVEDRRSLRGRQRTGGPEQGPQRLVASMPGRVVRVLAAEGETIAAGQGILVIEAMKMQNEIRSSKAGVLKKMLAREGGNVNAGDVLAIVE
jgi:biotin carboxyl carrier protein